MIRGPAQSSFGVLFNDGDGYHDVIPKVALPVLRATNAVDLVMIGDTLRVFLNDAEVGRAAIERADGGGFGLFAEPEAAMSFDNLLIASLRRGGS
jgi:hypothetical protein